MDVGTLPGYHAAQDFLRGVHPRSERPQAA
jgi:hypothetical protein